MAKRVGITTDVQERKQSWGSIHKNMTNFRVVKSVLTHSQAQKIEDKYISRGYEGHAGGVKKAGRQYSVYTFNTNKGR